MFGGWLRDSSDRDLSDFYFKRPSVSHTFDEAFARKRHILVYGLPRQGKRTLVQHCLGGDKSVIIYASPDTVFADIFRNYLLSVGCSVTVEQKRQRKLGGKAEVKFPWPLGPEASIGGGVDLSTEITQRSFSADIASPNDVCYLIREIGHAPPLIVHRFETLKAKQREALLDLLKITADSHVLQVILIASSVELPLDYAERIQTSRFLSVVHLPPLSREESDGFIGAALDALQCHGQAHVAGLLYDTFSGSLEQTLDGCALIAASATIRAALDRAVPETEVQDALYLEIRERTRNYLLALLCAIMDQGWTIDVARRLAHVAPEAGDGDEDAADGEESDPPGADDAPVADAAAATGEADEEMHPALANDDVYAALQEAIDAAATSRPALPAGVAPLFTQALRLGKNILKADQPYERVRLLAFALSQLLSEPEAAVSEQYASVDDEEAAQSVNFARVVCELLIAADLEQPLVLDEAVLQAYFAAQGLDMVRRRRAKPAITRFARRVRELQRELRIEPPLLAVSDDRSRITLWEPRNGRIFGDIRPQLKELLERLDDQDGADGD